MEETKKEIKEELTQEQLDNTSGGQKMSAEVYIGGGKFCTMTFETTPPEIKKPFFLTNAANSAEKTCLSPSCKKRFIPETPGQLYCGDCLQKIIKNPNVK